MGMGGIKPGGKSGSGRRGRKRVSAMAEINMTPMVDVMLVLLIIFMVSAPLLTVGVPIDLPETRAQAMEGQTEPIAITVNAQGQIFLQDTEVDINQMVTTLQAIAQNGGETRIFVRGDTTASYGTIMRVMGRLNEAGFRRIGLVTAQGDEG